MRTFFFANDLITAVLLAVCLACLAWPAAVRHRGRFFLGVAAVLAAMLGNVLAVLCLLTDARELGVFWSLVAGMMQLVAATFLVLGIGGLEFRELMSEVGGGFRSMKKQAPPGFAVIQPGGPAAAAPVAPATPPPPIPGSPSPAPNEAP
jgi:hypothetical protein